MQRYAVKVQPYHSRGFELDGLSPDARAIHLSSEDLGQKVLHGVPRTPVGIRTVNGAEIRVIGLRIGKRMHRVAVAVDLPVRAHTREFFGK